MKHPAIGFVCLLAMWACPALAQSDRMLDEAYDALKAENYEQARSLARRYLLENPRRYKADFIIAVSDCNLWPGEAAAREGLAEIERDYDLTQQAKSEIDQWSLTCASMGKERDEPKPQNTSEAQFGQGRPANASDPPLLVPVGPGQEPTIRRRNASVMVSPARMSELQLNTAYSYNDYSERLNVGSAADCSEICRAETTCRSMTYAKSTQKCWLKRSIPSATSGPGAEDFVSAHKIDR